MKGALALGFFIAISFTLIQCRSGGVKSSSRVSKPPKDFTLLKTESLVNFGKNESGQISSDGRRLLFVSSDRPQHKHRQAYELNLDSKRERRITFHDGDVTSIIYAADGRSYFYSSTTDEIKEDPDFIRKFRQQKSEKPEDTELDFMGYEWPRTEIYFSNREGSDIERITRNSGFDGFPTLSHDKKSLFFTSKRNGKFKVYSVRLPTSVASALYPTSTSEYFLDQNGKWTVASVAHSDLTKTSLEVSSGSKKSTPITQLNHHSIHPTWHSAGEWILFSSNSEDSNNYELYIIRRDGECLTRLTYSKENEFQPQFIGSTSDFIFTLQTPTQSQILKTQNYQLPKCDTDLKKEFK